VVTGSGPEGEADVAAAEARYDALRRDVRRAAARLAGLATIGRSDVERAENEIDAPPPSRALLELVMSTREQDWMAVLLCSLVLRRSVKGTAYQDPWLAIFSRNAARAVYELRMLGLFELRRALLDELIARPPPEMSRAELHFERANTRLVLTMQDGDAMRSVLEDLGVAMQEARQEQDADTYVSSIAMLAKLVAGPTDSRRDPEATEALGEQIGAMLEQSSALEPHHRVLLLQARAGLARARDPHEAIEALEEALKICEPADPLWAELAAELVSVLEVAGRAEDAIARGRAFLAEPACRGPSVPLAMLHLSVGWALARCERTREAREYLIAGLDGVRGRDRYNEIVARLQLAGLGLAERDRTLVDEQLQNLGDHWHALDDVQRGDICDLRAAAAALWSDPAAERDALDTALSIARDEPRRTRLLLRRALVDLSSSRSVTELDGLLARAIKLEPDHEVDAWIQRIAAAHAGSLSPATRELIRAWAPRRGLPSLAARMLHFEGRTAEAVAELRAALGAELAPVERLRCVHNLVGWLEPSDVDERRARCDELAALLEQVGDDPRVRLDLALGLHVTARGDLDALRSAWEHAMRAMQQVQEPRIVAHGQELLARLAVDIAAATLPASTVDAADKASWLDADLHVPAAELGRLRRAAVRALLVPGPLMHPRALAVARRLLGRARVDLAESTDRDAREELERLEQRLAWIDQRIAGRAAAESRDTEPFDDVPPWLIDLVAGRAPAPAEATPEIAEALSRARTARPDADERLVAALRSISIASAPPDETRRVVAWFEEGVELMHEVQRDLAIPNVREKIDRARRLLGDAVQLARDAKLAERFACLVSLGNAWRMPPDEDVQRALAAYDEAAPLEAPRDKRATLWKVHADALIQRGGPDDLRRAEELLTRALGARRDGWLRVEALVSAARVAQVHPDRDDAERAIQAAEHLMAAVRADRVHAEQLIHPLTALLTTWSRLRPADQRPDRYRAELRTIYPHRAAEIDARESEGDPAFARAIVGIASHPAGRAFMAVQQRLSTRRELRAGMNLLRDRFGAAMLQRLEDEAVAASLLDRPDEAEAVLASLASAQPSEARPGTLAGEVLLLAFLARVGRRSTHEVRERTERAIAEAATVGEPVVHAMLLSELARVWAPADHVGDPVRDFSLAAELLRRVVEIEGGESAALIDTLGALARALRYASGGTDDGTLRESRRLYHVVLERTRAEGDPDRIANILHNLADVEAYIGEGDRHARLVHAERLLDESVQTARSVDLRASYRVSLAWVRTQIGAFTGGDEGAAWLTRARETFDLVARDQLAPAERQTFDSSRATCLALLELGAGRRPAAIARYRQHLADLAACGNDHRIATAKHNLASVLMFGEDVTAAELREGLGLAREAAAMRTIERDARHCWETAFDAGRAITNQLDAGRADALPMPRQKAWSEALGWLRRAIEAAHTLGPGEELADAGLVLSRLAAHAASTEQAVDTAEEAWRAVRDAMPYLLTAPAQREREAHHALSVAHHLAARFATEAAAAPHGLAFMLVGETAEIVERWLLRAQLPTRRPLRARLSHPEGVSPLRWQEWRTALGAANPREIAAAVARVRGEAPEFLSEAGDLSSVTRWLLAHPRSAAVAAFAGGPGLLAWLITADERGQRQACILGLDAPPPPITSEDLAACMSRTEVGGIDGLRAQAAIGEWARRHLAEPIERLLGAPPAHVLWCPGPGLRLIAPAAIWTSSPVAVTTSMEEPAQRAYPGRHRSTLIALADPGPGNEGDLGASGRWAVDRLVTAAEPRGAVRRMGSAGRRFGRALLGRDPGVRDTPVSPQDLLDEAAEHDHVVIIAHGALAADGTAAMACVDREGSITSLTDDMLAEAPATFAGSTVVLLSCSAGQVTSMLADPGGLAGTLLSAGARCVVAPMWPVRIDVATRVGELVLRGATFGEEPSRVLDFLQRRGAEALLTTGVPPTTVEEQQAVALQCLGFVAWLN
jgi:hypothetical protein